MKQIFSTIFLSALIAACVPNKNQESPSSDTTDIAGLEDSQDVTNGNEKKILSITDTVYSGDTLKIAFKTPHPKDLAITTPSGKFFFLIYMGNDSKKRSLVDWFQFANMDYLEIITDKATANPWDANEPVNKLIFNETGIYEIQLSENLETDDGTPVETQKVYFIAQESDQVHLVRTFYEKHEALWASPPSDARDLHRKLDSLAKIYCTAELRSKANAWLEDGHDYYTDDWGPDWSEFTIAQELNNENGIIVSFIVDGAPYVNGKGTRQKIKLRVSVISMGDAYKLNSVERIDK